MKYCHISRLAADILSYLLKRNCKYCSQGLSVDSVFLYFSPMSSKQQSKKSFQPKSGNASIVPKLDVAYSFKIDRPWLWLSISVFVVYGLSLSFGLTELDDIIFVRDMKPYYEDLGNLVVSFQRGLFHPTNDMYYRPLFLDFMLLNYQLTGDSLVAFHFVNILLHLGAVFLLYSLLKKLNLKPLHAFLLALIFAIHPVLSQAVAWIPGRNDTLLAIFTFSFLIFCIDYSNKGKIKSLLFSFLTLLGAFFTKETAVFNAPVAFVLLTVCLNKKWLGNRQLLLYASWLVAFAIWYIVRANATLKYTYTDPAVIAHDFIHHLPALVQYLGKIFLPFNLSVFPIIRDTVYYYGIAAILILILLLYFAKRKNLRLAISGIIIFILFLIPAFLVPNKMNDQSFEHRLYLPMFGMLLVLSQTIIFLNKTNDKQLMYNIVGVCGIFGAINIWHQQDFKDKITFWTKAEASSPHSAYAVMMLGERLTDDMPKAYELIRRSYHMDSTEKYINYFYGMMLKNHDSILQSEKYFLAEKKISGFEECDFHLAAIAFAKKDFITAEHYLESYTTAAPTNADANNNLLLLYIQEKQKDKALAQIKKMQQNGVSVAPVLVQQAQSL
jgi:4-amino-4-deoxy-L-arabinose transferase-like glycosyltransferase